MCKFRILFLAVCSVGFLATPSLHAQAWPSNALYQIVSGRYSECCGIAGPFIYPLPNESQGYVELSVDPERNLARMTFLSQDRQKIFSIPTSGIRPGFTYDLRNGMVHPDYIQFGLFDPFPGPQASVNFVVSNTAEGLRFSGTVNLLCLGCADIPTQFKHTNVVAVLAPVATIRVSEVEVCWTSARDQNYQVQYQSSEAPDKWIDLGAPVVGTGSTLCLQDKVTPGVPQRIYRVYVVP